MSAELRLVALVGAECCGKSDLAVALADRLDGIVVSEYLREFCERQGRVPLAHEQAAIARVQREREQQAVLRARESGIEWLFCDTSPLMIALNSIMYFDDHALLADALRWQQHYRISLLCEPDIAWCADGIQRDGPLRRAQMHEQLVELFSGLDLSWARVEGAGPDRLASALAALGQSG